jgi:hypothetical protein
MILPCLVRPGKEPEHVSQCERWQPEVHDLTTTLTARGPFYSLGTRQLAIYKRTIGP